MLRVLIGLYSFTQAFSLLSVKIGGVFDPSDSQSVLGESSFLLALRHLNNKSDGFYDNLLPNTELLMAARLRHNGMDIAQSLLYMLDDVNFLSSGSGVDVIAAVIPSKKNFIGLLADEDIAIIANDIGFGVSAPQFFPSPPFQGRYLQKLLCQYGYSRVAIITSANEFGTKSFGYLTDQTFCALDVLYRASFDANIAPDGDEVWVDIKQTGTTVVVVLVDDLALGAAILKSGYESDALLPYMQVFVSDSMLKDSLASLLPDSSIVLQGLIGVTYSPQPSTAFAHSWRTQTSTLGSTGNCAFGVDDSTDANPLYEFGSDCIGLDFASFSPDGRDIPSSALDTYDAIIAMAYGLHELIEVQGKSTIDKADLYAAIIGLSPFSGCSGAVDFDSYGHRDSDLNYNIMNYQGSSFALVGSISTHSNFTPCSGPECGVIAYTYQLRSQPPADLPPYYTSTAPEVVKVGGFFHHFDSEGNFDPEQAQYLAAFLMAIREINDKSDGILDDLLPSTKLIVSIESPHGLLSTAVAASRLSSEAFGSGVDVAISALGNEDVVSANGVFLTTKVPMIHSVATEPILGDGELYPYKAALVPADTYEGMVFQSLLCDYFNYRYFSVVASNDFFGIKATVETQDDTYCVDKILSQHVLYSDGSEVDSVLNELKSAGPNVIVFLFSLDHLTVAAALLAHKECSARRRKFS
jgi:hypothetical protein